MRSSSSPERCQATLVTALYDLGRGKMKKEANNYRPFPVYLDWFKHLLKVNAGLVIYIPPTGRESDNVNLAEFIRQHRNPDYLTQIKIRPLSSLPLYSERSRIQQVMDQLPTQGINYPNLEFHHPDYIILMYSKFDFLREVITDNPYSTKYFFWVDAGYFRTVPGAEINYPWPDPNKLEALEEKFLLQNRCLNPKNHKVLHEFNPNLSEAERQYLKLCPNEIVGCIFGGHESIVLDVGQKTLNLLERMLDIKLVNNEQQALSILVCREPTKFILYPHENDGRELLADLSAPGYMKIPYSKCPQLKTFTVASREIKDADLQPWIETAKYYGYDYEVLGRSDRWMGWPFRTRTYLEALRAVSSTHEVAILSDGTDLFFCGPAWEAHRKFEKLNQEIIIGGENYIAYSQSHGRNSSYRIEEFFVAQCSSRFCFPNGGFVIGTIPALINLMNENLNSGDDQAGYMDLRYEQKINYTLDERNSFIANIPNYHDKTERDVGFWQWDKNRGRYYNPHTREYPIALHFPGRNMHILQKMFQ